MLKLGEDPITDARKQLNWGQILVLSFQHVFAFFGATVLVPILTGLPVQTALFFAGAGTILFHILTKFKVPAFLGSSFAFLGGYAAIAENPAYAEMNDIERLAYANGGVVIAGLMYLVLALIIKKIGIERVLKFLPPIVTSPIIICIGLTLAPSAITNASTNWPLALIAMATMIICAIPQILEGLRKQKYLDAFLSMAQITPILMGVLVAYIAALIMNACGIMSIDFVPVSEAKIIGLPPIHLAKFGLSAIITMVPIALSTQMEHIGDISALSDTTGEDYIKDPGLHRTLLGDGLATVLSAFLFGPPNTTYGENTGVLALTKVYDPFLIRMAAIIAMILGCLPKVSAVINTMPAAIIGGVSFILYGMISGIGMKNLQNVGSSEENSLNSQRNLIIFSIILVCGLGFKDGITFTASNTEITITGLAIASVVGILLNAIIPGNNFNYKDGAKFKSDNYTITSNFDTKSV